LRNGVIFLMAPPCNATVGSHKEKGYVNELRLDNQFLEIKPYACRRTLPFGKGNVTSILCVKPPETDLLVSKHILKYGVWEYGTVVLMVEILQQFPFAGFLDIGANIGMFTTVAAAMGHKVTAVDAGLDNLSYIKRSLQLSGTSKNVKFIHNAVSDSYTEVYPVELEQGNAGGQTMFTQEQMGSLHKNYVRVGDLQVSVKMQDILDVIDEPELILKIDIEGYECKALPADILLGDTGKQIFVVFIEWNHPNFGINCNNYEGWVDNWYEGGYIPFAGDCQYVEVFEENFLCKRNLRKLERKYLKKNNDIVWVYHLFNPKLMEANILPL